MDYINQLIQTIQSSNDPVIIYGSIALAIVVGGFFVKSIINYVVTVAAIAVMLFGFSYYTGKEIPGFSTISNMIGLPSHSTTAGVAQKVEDSAAGSTKAGESAADSAETGTSTKDTIKNTIIDSLKK